jgi:glutathione S-transferase
MCGRNKGLEREIANLQERGQTAIDGIEMYLAEDNVWLVGNSYSIADICLYACTSMAEAVGFRIDRNMRSWLSRVEEVDGWEEYETACT